MQLKKTSWPGLILVAALLAAVPTMAQPGSFSGSESGPGGDAKGGQGAAWADGDHPRHQEMQERRLERLTVFLDLNAQQVEQWRAAHETRADARQAGRDEMRELHQQIQDLAAASEPDATAIGELVIEAQQLKAAGKAEREAFHAELMTILTPEQQERFEAMQETRPERGRRGRHGRRGFRHGGPGFGGDSLPRG